MKIEEEIMSEELKEFKAEESAYWAAHAEFGPFERRAEQHWFFARGYDVAMAKMKAKLMLLESENDKLKWEKK